MKFTSTLYLILIFLFSANFLFAQNTTIQENASLQCIDSKLAKSGKDKTYLLSSLYRMMAFVNQENNDSIFALNEELYNVLNKSGFYKGGYLDYSVLIDCMESSPGFDSLLVDSNLSFYHLYELFSSIEKDTTLLYDTNPALLLRAYDQAISEQDSSIEFYKVISLIYFSSIVHKDNIERHKEYEQAIDALDVDDIVTEVNPTEKDTIYDANKIYKYYKLEKRPEFPGGIDSLFKYINDKVLASGISKKHTVFIGFVISENGSVSDAKLLRGDDEELIKIAFDIVNSMPNWKPGKVEGKNVKVYYVIPVKFE